MLRPGMTGADKQPGDDSMQADYDDFVSLVRAQVERFGETRAYTYLRQDGRELVEDRVTYSELDASARAIAVWLRRRPEADRPVLLLYVEAIDFLRAFLGCLYAGTVAVPAPLPTDARSMQRSARMFEDADIGLVLTTAAVEEPLTSWLKEAGLAGQVTCVATDAERLADPDDWEMPELDGETVAFLQYTSGSTSEPKGVVITHSNLLHNEAAIAKALKVDHTTCAAGWIPYFHDMGLIGLLLQSIYVGANLVFMSPLTFLKRPVRWLDMIDRYKADVTVAPNFAYELVARRISDEDVARLDLSSLRVALNGAEPIRPHTLDSVIDRLGEAGFGPNTFLTCYGMAEATLLVTGSEPGQPPQYLDVDPAALERGEAVPAAADGATRLVSSGTPPELDIRIVQPEALEVLPDSTVGEIWLRGGSIAAGYWKRPEETAEKFGAHTDAGDGPYLRTGDLGLLHDGHLFVTGRLKDILIINGRNIYPQDIEEAVRLLHPALTEAPGVVLAVDSGKESVVVIQGVKTSELKGAEPADLVAQIKTTVARTFEVAAPSVVLVEKRGVLRTTSGKVQRRAMEASFLENGIEGLLHEDIDPVVARLRGGASQAAPA
jgi:acyl-CoA synthetase (AMP-forming)/AMP-acid ligase II